MKGVVACVAAAVLAVLVAPPATALDPYDFGTDSGAIAKDWFESQDPVSVFVLLAYVTPADLANPNLDLQTHCGHAETGMIPNFPANTPKKPTYAQIWGLIRNPTYYKYHPYGRGTYPEDYAAALSNNCFVARFLRGQIRFAAHYEQLLAAWMYNEMRPLTGENKLVAYGSRKPCDFGEQVDDTVRGCSDVLREVFRMRQNKQRGDLSGGTLYMNKLDNHYFIIFDWPIEGTILQDFRSDDHIDALMERYIEAPVAVSGGSHPADQPNCVFPFTYQGKTYYSCIILNNVAPWCSTTANYDADHKWGECPAARTKGLVEARLSTGGVSKDCMFPFSYKNRMFYDCSYDHSGTNEPWCYTDKQSNTWGNCVTQNRVNGTAHNGDNERCVFPFVYEGETYYSCTTVGNGGHFWCATTKDYDQDRLWANCY